MTRSPSAASEESDAELIARVSSGDAAALSALVLRHQSGLLRLMHRVVGRGGGAQDLMQELWLKLWTQPRRYDAGRGAFSAWVKRVAVNLAIDERRRNRSGARATVALDGVADFLSDPTPGPAQLAQIDAHTARLGAAIDALPRRQRDALLLCYHGEMTAAQASQALGVSVPAVEALLVRARRTLRQRLRDSEQQQ